MILEIYYTIAKYINKKSILSASSKKRVSFWYMPVLIGKRVMPKGDYMYVFNTHSLSTVKHSTPGARARTFAVLLSSLK